jgi:hypothetical protein
MRAPSEKPSLRPSGGPWSKPPSRLSARPRTHGPEPASLAARQRLRIAAAVLGSAIAALAAWHALGDESPSEHSRRAPRRASTASITEARHDGPLDAVEERDAGTTPGDAGLIAAASSAEGAALGQPFTLTWLFDTESSEPSDAGLARAPTERVPAPPSPPVAATLPATHRALDTLLPAAPALVIAESGPTQPAPIDPVANDEDPGPPVQRHVVHVITTRWQQPGLCPVGSRAAAARHATMLQFRRLYWDNDAALFLDPRLSNSIQPRLIGQLEAAAGTVRHQLQLEPAHPNVFAYADERLLLAASCANKDVVAYYDGAIHVVPSHADVAQSVVHEYTHHALISSGLVGPAWAQEGIAMTVANETWWRQGEWLDRVAEKPFSIESMEQAVPYTLSSEHATLFYVQAAAMVACALKDDDEGGLPGLLRSLRRSRSGALDYTLPGLSDPRFFRACANQLVR